MELWQLKQRQGLPLEVKIRKSLLRIEDWYERYDGQVSVSFSGGKDSTVLLHLVRSIYPEVPAVFSDTGLEFPEIKEFVKSMDNVTWVRPKINFRKVLETYGYPVISKRVSQYLSEIQRPTDKNIATVRLRLTGIRSSGKLSQYSMIPKKWQFIKDAPFKVSHKCCDHMKKKPMNEYSKASGRKAYVGTMADEGENRELDYLMHGCNAYDIGQPKSRPLSFWTEKDIWEYIRQFNIPYSKIYDMGYERTGCVYCAFGANQEKGVTRFQRMQKTHPQLWDYCMKDWDKGGLGMADVLDYIGVEWKDEFIGQVTMF